MPIVDGLEVTACSASRAREQSERRPRARIVMLTRRISPADLDTCMVAGADACVAKPYTPEELLAAVAPGIEWRGGERARRRGVGAAGVGRRGAVRVAPARSGLQVAAAGGAVARAR
ncbi:MAG: hypothetical protein U1F11_10715 [Steroidobacteraceae bacterium]